MESARRPRSPNDVPDVPANAPTMLRKHQLAKVLGVNPWTVDRYRREQSDFPKPYKFSDQIIVWDLNEIKAWIATRRGER